MIDAMPSVLTLPYERAVSSTWLSRLAHCAQPDIVCALQYVVCMQELEAMGYTIAAYPLTLLSASIKAMQAALVRLKDGAPCDDLLVPFKEVSHC
jgi:hypothetical protein